MIYLQPYELTYQPQVQLKSYYINTDIFSKIYRLRYYEFLEQMTSQVRTLYELVFSYHPLETYKARHTGSQHSRPPSNRRPNGAALHTYGNNINIRNTLYRTYPESGETHARLSKSVDRTKKFP